MAVTQTTRLQIYRWNSDSDPYTRAQMDESHANLESNVAAFISDTIANQSSYSAATYVKSFFYATDTQILYYSDGTNWKNLTAFGTSISANTPGNASAGGAATTAARSDHVHSMPDWGVVGEISSIGTAAAAGSTSKFARIDHVHVLGANSVTSSAIASGAINSSSMLGSGVVTTSALASQSVTRSVIEESQRIPSGSMMAFGGTSAPTGWLLCDGSAVSRTTYSDLFAAIGTRYGSGDNSTTFNLPDFRDRLMRGGSTAGGAVASVGADTVTLTEANLPSHLHGLGTIDVASHGSHSHSVSLSTNSVGVSHNHTFSHTHQTQLTNKYVTGGGGFFGIEWYYPPGGSADRYMDGPYSMFDGGSGPQAEIGVAQLISDIANTISQTGTTTSTANPSHQHTVSGNTGTVELTHTVSGSTASTGSGTAVSILPKTTTVNFIIKI